MSEDEVVAQGIVFTEPDDDLDAISSVVSKPMTALVNKRAARKSATPVKRKNGTVALPAKSKAPPVREVPIIKAKKPHRYRPGTVAIREIRKMQKETNHLIPKKRFVSLVREMAEDVSSLPGTIRFTKDALNALQEAAEAHIISVFQKTNIVAIHSDRSTIFPMDMRIATRLVNE